mmetsp:Transcript_5414/g.11865  ORF Transcript_5414/g.11865 Transcript_5414/m.11865 type:complete len:93 (+) Transcript_5414:1354-1632(+)
MAGSEEMGLVVEERAEEEVKVDMEMERDFTEVERETRALPLRWVGVNAEVAAAVLATAKIDAVLILMFLKRLQYYFLLEYFGLQSAVSDIGQ